MINISKIEKAPQFDIFLQVAQEQPIVVEADRLEKLRSIYEKMKGVVVCGYDEYRNIWFHIERGTIEDFGDYDQYVEEEMVSNREEFEEIWLCDYPEEKKWYNFEVNEYNNEYYFYIDGKLTFHISKETPKYRREIDIDPLIDYLGTEVNRCVDWLQKDESDYNCYVNENLSYDRRTGKIFRQKLWEVFPLNKERITKGISEKDVEILKQIVNQTNNQDEMNYLSEMTAGKFFDYCKMGYEANNYFKDKKLSAIEMYNAFADGRHEGLTEIDMDSPKAFSKWYHGGRIGGHPWEICRGGNSTHISLYVEYKLGKWFLRLAGSSAVRVNETVKIAIALYNSNVPFILQEAEEIYKMICGTDYIGIVPHEVFPRYCHSLFSEEKERIIDFMNLGWEETDKLIPAAEWYPIKITANK